MKIFLKLKYILVVLVLMIIASSAYSQGIKTSYFIDNTPLRMSFNPAFRPAYGYVNIPVIGSIGASFKSNSLSIEKLIYPRNGKLVTFLDTSVNASEFLSKLKDDNQLNIDVNFDMFGFGFYDNNEGYWNGSMGFTTKANVNVPKSLFEFIKLGSGSKGASYEIENLSVVGSAYMDFTVGYSRPINDQITVGAALKFLVGIGSVDVRIEKLDITAMADIWKIKSSGYANMNVGGLGFSYDKDGDFDGVSDFPPLDQLQISGYGMAVDLGVTYRPLGNLLISAAVTDLGFIYWREGSEVSATTSGEFLFEGFDLLNDEVSIDDQIDSIGDDLKALVSLTEKENPVSRTQMITASFNVGAEYSVLDDKIGFGLMYFGRILPYAYEHDLTLLATFRPASWFSGALSYSFLNGNYDSFGVVLNFSASWINFFVGTDYVFTNVNSNFIPFTQNAINAYVGISIPIGVRKAKARKNMVRGTTSYMSM